MPESPDTLSSAVSWGEVSKESSIVAFASKSARMGISIRPMAGFTMTGVPTSPLPTEVLGSKLMLRLPVIGRTSLATSMAGRVLTTPLGRASPVSRFILIRECVAAFSSGTVITTGSMSPLSSTELTRSKPALVSVTSIMSPSSTSGSGLT